MSPQSHVFRQSFSQVFFSVEKFLVCVYVQTLFEMLLLSDLQGTQNKLWFQNLDIEAKL